MHTILIQNLENKRLKTKIIYEVSMHLYNVHNDVFTNAKNCFNACWYS